MPTDEEIINSLRPPGDELAPMSDDVAPPAASPAADPNAYVQGSSPVPPNPAAAFEAPTEGPPAPSSTDAIGAGLPAPLPGGPTEDPLKQLAPAVPREAPGMVSPGGAPAALAATPAPGDKGTNDIEGALSDVEQSRKDANDAKLEQFRGKQVEDQSQHQAQVDFLASRRAQLEEQNKQAEATAKLDAASDAKAKADVQKSSDAIKNFKFKNLFSDKTTSQKVTSALSMALLAIGAGMMKTPKYAIEILDKEKQDDHARQLDQLHGLQDDYVRQQTGMQDAALGRKKMAADVQLGNARKNEIIAAQFEETAARSKDPNAANDANVYATKLKAEADQDRLTALTTLRTLHLADEKAQLDEQLKQAQIHNLNESAALKSRGLGQGHKAHGAGSGTGAGSPVATNAGELAKRIEEGKEGKPLSESEMIAAANELHIPLEGKAGQVSLKSVRGSVAFNADAARKDARLGQMGDKALESQVKNFATEHQLPKLEAASRKLDEVRSMLDSGNPAAAMSALMEYDAAAKGSSATESSMHAIQGHLGGSWDHFKGMIENKQTGNFGEEQTKILRGAIDAGRKAFKESIEPIHQSFGGKFDYSKPGVAQAAASLFGALGYRGKTMPAASGGEQAQGDPRIPKARAAVAPNSGATDVQRKNAQAFLDAHGG